MEHEKPAPPKKFVDSLWCVYMVSVLSAFNAEIITFPLDLIKTRLQIQGEKEGQIGRGPYKGMTKTGIEIIQKSGFFKLWEGLTAQFARHTLYSGIRLVIYRRIREYFLDRSVDKHLRVWESVVCGVTSGVIAQYVSNPADVVKIQMQMEGKRKLLGMEPRILGFTDGCRHVWREGGVKGLWRGAIPNITRAALVTVGDISGYDVSKQFILEKVKLKDNFFTHTWASFNAGFFAACLATPADVIKSRVMNQPADETGRGLLYSGPMDCIRKTVKGEGIFALYKGFFPMWIRLGPWAIVFWLSYEQMMKQLGAHSF